jgi:hypothetical protein
MKIWSISEVQRTTLQDSRDGSIMLGIAIQNPGEQEGDFTTPGVTLGALGDIVSFLL